MIKDYQLEAINKAISSMGSDLFFLITMDLRSIQKEVPGLKNALNNIKNNVDYLINSLDK